MHKRFDHKEFEQKWQEKWRAEGLYEVGERNTEQEKEYVLVEWPYPSGNLHIGHWYAFAIPDIYARYKRMKGSQVLFPMGFDAFGLPAENAAIKNDVNPKDWTNKNIAYMRDQLESMGNSFSWDHTTSSTDPDYYRWTQWVFTKFFENDLAYRGEAIVNWDPVDNTVIANEQVLADGTSERSGAVVERKVMPQWMLRISNFADALIDDLDTLNWPAAIKESQKNWIGRKEGIIVSHKVTDRDLMIETFSAYPAWMFADSFIVLAPEHPLIAELVEGTEYESETKAFVEKTKNTSEAERTNNKRKEGVFTGAYAENPYIEGEKMPIWVANFALMNFGTGAIRCSGHDIRDVEFAKMYDIETRQVVGEDEFVDAHDNRGILHNSGPFSGREISNELISEMVDWMEKENLAKRKTTYRLRDWSIGRQRYWGVPIPIVYDPNGRAHVIPEEHLPWLLPEDVDFRPTGEAPLAKSAELQSRTEKIFGKGWTPEVETMDTFVDSSWYFLRYIDNQNHSSFSDSKKQAEWLPVDLYFGGAEHTTMHLLYSRFFQKALHSLGLAEHDEPYRRRINRGLILGPDGNKMSKSKGNVIDPDKQVELVGSDTVKMYLAFMGPFQGANYPWDNGGVAGVHRFLERVYGLSEHIGEETAEMTRLLHKTIKKVNTDIEEFKFNTAISAMMVYVNGAEKSSISVESYEEFLKVLAPFAPHLCEELWNTLEKQGSIHSEGYPQADELLAKDDLIAIGVQINGKLRGEIQVSPEATEEDALAAVKQNQTLQKKIDGREPSKIIYVAGRILNLILTD